MRDALQDMKKENPTFWAELTQKRGEELSPPEDVAQEEDELDVEEQDFDDSNIPVELVIESMVKGSVPEGIERQSDSRLASSMDAEKMEEKTKQAEEKPMGRGKRERRENQWYSSKTFWKH